MHNIISLRAALTVLGAATALAALPAIAQDGKAIRYDTVPNGAYSVVAEVQAKPGKEAALREATLPLVDLVRSDPKSLVYFFQEDREKPDHFVFYEVFANVADFEAHNAMPYVKAWFAKLPDLVDGGVMVRRMAVLGQH